MMMSERGRGAPSPAELMTSPLVRLRKPRRLSVTIPSDVLDRLTRQADEQGRSTSNLAAFLLEASISPAAVVAPRELWAR